MAFRSYVLPLIFGTEHGFPQSAKWYLFCEGRIFFYELYGFVMEMPSGSCQSVGFGLQAWLRPSWTTPINALNHSNGQLTSFASNGRVEDIFLRFLDWCDERGEPLENEEYLRKSLKHLKYEAEMLDKIGRIEELERELSDLNRKKYEAEEKMRFYNPDLIQTFSIPEACHRQQFVMDALERIEKLKHAKLLEKEVSPSNLNDVEMPALEVGSSSAVAEATNSETHRNQLPNDQNGKNIEVLEPSTS